MFSDERSQRITERLKKYGHDIEMSDLIYHGERSHVIEYLTGARLGRDVADDAGRIRRQWFRVPRERNDRVLLQPQLRQRGETLANRCELRHMML